MRNGKLEVRLTIEDVRALKTAKVISASAPAGDVLGAGHGTRPPDLSQSRPVRHAQSARRWKRTLRRWRARDAAVMEVGLGVAIAADPDFAPPYRLLAQIKAQRQDRAGAVATLDQALARGNAIPELDRARLELESAELTGNPDARQARSSSSSNWIAAMPPPGARWATP